MSQTVIKKLLPESAPTLYVTPSEYVPGSVSLFVNGNLRVPSNDDGFTELNNKKILLKEPAHPQDDLQVMYETGSSVINDQISGITFPLRVRLNGYRFTTTLRGIR